MMTAFQHCRYFNVMEMGMTAAKPWNIFKMVMVKKKIGLVILGNKTLSTDKLRNRPDRGRFSEMSILRRILLVIHQTIWGEI